jgi:CDP-diacylglycerol---glycerol-3-phosphate 3-phosphatidyltransferase
VAGNVLADEHRVAHVVGSRAARAIAGRAVAGGELRIAERVKPLGLGWPNVVSVLRALLVPVLVVLVLVDTPRASVIAATVFLVGAASDSLDGYLARRHSMKTATGAWLDPLSDKLLVSAPIVVLAARGDFPAWAAVVIVGREIAVAVLRAYLGSQRTSMPASWLGKLKTVSQIAAVFLYLLPLGDGAGALRMVVLVGAVALTVISGIDYFVSSRSRVAGT